MAKFTIVFTSKPCYNVKSKEIFSMQNLINELQLPRTINPSIAAMRAAKALQELHAKAQQDTQARIDAEHKLVEAFADIQRLTKELQDAKETIDGLSTKPTHDAEPGVS